MEAAARSGRQQAAGVKVEGAETGAHASALRRSRQQTPRHGKEGVVGSSPTLGSLVPARGVALAGALESHLAALRDWAARTCHLALVGTGVRRSCQAVEIALPHRASCAGIGGGKHPSRGSPPFGAFFKLLRKKA